MIKSQGGPPDHKRPEDGPVGIKPKFIHWPGIKSSPQKSSAKTVAKPAAKQTDKSPGPGKK